MVDTLMVGWGISLDAAEFGARVQAYVQARQAIRAFELCVQIGWRQHTTIGNLPVELVRMIRRCLEDRLLYLEPVPDEVQSQGLMVSWARHIRCVEGRCSSADHPCPECSTEDCQHEDTRETLHKREIKTFLVNLGHFAPSVGQKVLISTFNKAMISDFGLQMYFSSDANDLNSCNIHAYLLRPSHHTMGSAETSHGYFEFSATMLLSPSTLTPLSLEVKRNFRVVMKSLGLKPYIAPT